MNGAKILAIVLIVAGVLGLVYGSFSYTKSTHEAKLGPIELSVKDKQTVNVPVWAGVGGIVVGGALLLFSRKKKLAPASGPPEPSVQCDTGPTTGRDPFRMSCGNSGRSARIYTKKEVELLSIPSNLACVALERTMLCQEQDLSSN